MSRLEDFHQPTQRNSWSLCFLLKRNVPHPSIIFAIVGSYLQHIWWENNFLSPKAVPHLQVATFRCARMDRETSAEQCVGLLFAAHPNYVQHFLQYAMRSAVILSCTSATTSTGTNGCLEHDRSYLQTVSSIFFIKSRTGFTEHSIRRDLWFRWLTHTASIAFFTCR